MGAPGVRCLRSVAISLFVCILLTGDRGFKSVFLQRRESRANRDVDDLALIRLVSTPWRSIRPRCQGGADRHAAARVVVRAANRRPSCSGGRQGRGRGDCEPAPRKGDQASRLAQQRDRCEDYDDCREPGPQAVYGNADHAPDQRMPSSGNSDWMSEKM